MTSGMGSRNFSSFNILIFLIVFLLVAVSFSKEILVRPSIPKSWRIFPKCENWNHQKQSETTLLLSAMVFFRSVKVLSVNEGFMVLQNSLFSVIYFLLRLMKNLFLVSLNSFTQKFLYMLYADLVAFVFFPFLHLFNNLGFVWYTFLSEVLFSS